MFSSVTPPSIWIRVSYPPSGDHLLQFPDLIVGGLNEFLPAKARIYSHDQYHIQIAKTGSRRETSVWGLSDTAGFIPSSVIF